jgi:sugar/nucleoside kinase (ribokinase family)
LADAFAFVEDDVPKTMGLHPGTFNQVPDYRMRAIVGTLRNPGLMAGGSAANTVKLAARLGADAHFVGQCGHDEAGQIFESELLGAGVKVNLTRIDSPTGLCVTFLTPAPMRTVATFRSASGNLAVGLLGDTLLDAADVVVVEGYLLDEPEFLDELVARCVAHGKAIALDLGQEPIERHRDDLLRHLGSGAVRYLFLRAGEAATLTGLEAEEALGALSASGTTVVIKAGEEYLVQSGGKPARVPCDTSTAVDATGADDAFEAGFLWAAGRGWTAVEACTAGNLVATCVAEAPGTRVDAGRWALLQRDLEALAGR